MLTRCVQNYSDADGEIVELPKADIGMDELPASAVPSPTGKFHGGFVISGTVLQ